MQIYKKVEGQLQEIQSVEPGCWVNIYPPFDYTKLEAISRQYNIPLDFLTDSLDVDERSRHEREDDTDIFVLNAPVTNNGIIDTQALYISIPIGIIRQKGFILTISSFTCPVIDDFLKNKVRHFDPANQEQFILQIFSRTAYYYLHFLKELNIRRYEFERELYSSSRNKELANLLNIQKSLVYFVTNIRSNNLMMLKTQRFDVLKIRTNEELSDLLEDIIIDNNQAQEMSDIYSNILNGTMDAFASIISNNLNTVMRRLTSITIVLMIPTLVASFYGMNVGLPFERSAAAFSSLIFLSILLSALVVYVFMRKRWL